MNKIKNPSKTNMNFLIKWRKWVTCWTRASDPWIVGQTWLDSSHWIIVRFKNHVSLLPPFNITHSIKCVLRKLIKWGCLWGEKEWKFVKLWSGRRKRLCFYRYTEREMDRGEVFSWWIVVERNFWCSILCLSEWLEERGCMFVLKNDGNRMYLSLSFTLTNYKMQLCVWVIVLYICLLAIWGLL